MKKRLWPLWLAIVTALSLLLFLYRYLGVLANGHQASWLKILIEESVAVGGGGLLFFALLPLVRRLPLTKAAWARRLPWYALSFGALSVVHTSWNWGMRTAIFELLGLGRYDYGIMPLRYGMELPIDILGYSLATAAIHGVDRIRAARERELRAARLESSLARAQVHNLRLQLQPHFLFNALNTISAVMYDNPAQADEILDRLAILLRASLKAGGDEVPLGTELDLLDAYLAILAARFGERIRVERQIAPEASNILVPPMLLQPLVENAVRHGSAETEGSAVITVTAELAGDDLILGVHDNGPGHPVGSDPLGQGLGLRASAERLALLYGDAGELVAGNDPAGGFRVTLRLPARRREAS